MSDTVAELSLALKESLEREPTAPQLATRSLPLGVHYDVPERVYHSDPCDMPSLSVSIAQALVLESPAHAYLRHPRLGGQSMTPTTDMDRGTLIHALLLGKGESQIQIVECDDWKKKANQTARKEIRKAGLVPVTRKLYDDAVIAADVLRVKLANKGYPLQGRSEVTVRWEEQATSGRTVQCRGRVDHLDGADVIDLKITGDANPKTLLRGQLTRMGYDIQGAAYPRALGSAYPNMLGRYNFVLLFCEPEPPYCVTPVRFAGSLRELGQMKWERAVSLWDRCLTENHWPDYTDSVVFAEGKPWEFEAEESAA